MFGSIEFGSFWFFIFIFFVIAVSNAKSQKKKNKNAVPKNPAPVAKTEDTVREKASPAAKPVRTVRASSGASATSQKISLLSAAMEDRKHDWLARQLAEERSILRRGSLTDMGASHNISCDARELKIEHEVRHSEINRNNTPYS